MSKDLIENSDFKNYTKQELFEYIILLREECYLLMEKIRELS
jgi:hypothetical protein